MPPEARLQALFDFPRIGEDAHDWMCDLFPIPRSLTGPGVRATLDYLGDLLPGLERHRIASGESALDWSVPKEWRIRSATLTGPDGEVIANFDRHNLHVLGYSTGVDAELSLEDLQPHLYSLSDMPDAIPYITSYYKERWGFCLPHRVREALKPGTYRARIDAELIDGHLDYAELVLPGETTDEILLSTYICHPSMANNELSGPVVATAMARWLRGLPLKHTIRVLFVPETIGALVYLSRNLDRLKARLKAGFVLSCMGDERGFSMMPSRRGDTLADRAARLALDAVAGEGGWKGYSFLQRGSDERQYCSPGADLPVASVMRSKYAEYPEYHTSADDLDLVTPDGLQGGFQALATAIACIEANACWRTTTVGEPQLGKRGLYPTISTRESAAQTRAMTNVLAYADGQTDFIDLCRAINAKPTDVASILARLLPHGLVEITPG